MRDKIRRREYALPIGMVAPVRYQMEFNKRKENEFGQREDWLCPYFNRETIMEPETGTYADRAAPIQATAISWNHSLSEVLGALLRHGLEIRHFEEYDYSPYNCFAGLEAAGERRYQFPHLRGKLPMLYSLVARKK